MYAVADGIDHSEYGAGTLCPRTSISILVCFQHRFLESGQVKRCTKISFHVPELLNRNSSIYAMNTLSLEQANAHEAILRNHFDRYDKPRNYQDSLFSLSSLPHTHPSGGGDLVCTLRILQQ
jgi:hypothetical protein